jgi:MtfA peptidase
VRWLHATSHDDVAGRWEEMLASRIAWWPLHDADDRASLSALVDAFLGSKRFEAARGFTLTEDIPVTIAAEACLMILGLGLEWYRDVHAIIVYPSTAVRGGTRRIDGGLETSGPVSLAGEAMLHGPVMIAWDQALGAARHPERGHNVVFHEFAHKIDMVDGVADGRPPLGDPELARRWTDVMGRALDDLRAGSPRFIDDYGATGPGELFAVVTEAFFDVPTVLHAREPEIYELLSAFYRQDPTTRFHSPTPGPVRP